MQTKQNLAIENENLVHWVCHKYFRKQIAEREYGDIAGIGMIGLMKAIKNFKPEKGHAFSTYAVPMIHGEINRYLRDYREDGIHVQRSKRGVIIPLVPLDAPVTDESETPVSALLGEEEDTTEVFLSEFLDVLENREREVCKMRVDGLVQEQIAEILGISQSQISRILKVIKEKYEQFERGEIVSNLRELTEDQKQVVEILKAGKRMKDVANETGIPYANVAYLKKTRVDACITKEPDEVLEMNVTLVDDGTTTEVKEATVGVVKKETISPIFDEMTEHIIGGKGIAEPVGLLESTDQPLLDIENQAVIITPLLQGIARYLERLGKQNVQVTVVVRKVD